MSKLVRRINGNNEHQVKVQTTFSRPDLKSEKVEQKNIDEPNRSRFNPFRSQASLDPRLQLHSDPRLQFLKAKSPEDKRRLLKSFLERLLFEIEKD